MATICASAMPGAAQDGRLRIIAFGAHPDDNELRLGGTAAKWAALGHHVKFVSDGSSRSSANNAAARQRNSFGRYSGASSNGATLPVATSYSRSCVARAAVHRGS